MSENKKTEKQKRVAVLSRYPGETILVGETVIRILKVDKKRISIYVETSLDQEIKRLPKDQSEAVSSVIANEGVKKKD
nr:hypothetical protein HAGR004_25560 [Bdellovibrio sp. HAGR004]